MYNVKNILFGILFICLLPFAGLAKENTINKFSVYGEPKELVNGHLPYANPNALKGGSVTLYGYDSFDTLNPFSLFGVAPKDAIRLLYLPLFTTSLNVDNTVYGLLAEKFSINGNKVKIYLRKDAVWQNGASITAEDVEFTIKTLSENSGSYYKAVFSTIKNIEIIDDKTFIFEFETTNTKKTLATLADLPIIPKFFWQNVDFKTDLIVAPIGSGFYFVDGYEFGKHIVFERVKGHWAENLPALKGMYNFNTIRYEYIKDKGVVRESFKAGILDIVQEYNAKQWVRYWQTDSIENGTVLKRAFTHSRIPPFQSFVFNVRKNKFKDARVRQAIGIAFDFDWINKVLLHNQYKRIYSLFQDSVYEAKGLPEGKELEILTEYKEYFKNEVFTQNLDERDEFTSLEDRLMKADKLLKEAGYIVKNNKRIDSITGEQLEFEILVISKSIARLSMPLAHNLKLLGIKVNIRVVNISNYVHMLNKYDYDMVIKSWISGAQPSAEHVAYWGSASVNVEGGRNLSGIDNPGVDAVVNGMITSENEDDLIAYARVLDRVLRAEHINIPQVYSDSDRLLWYDKFGIPESIPDYGVDIFLWWVK